MSNTVLEGTSTIHLYAKWSRVVYSFCLYLTGDRDLASWGCSQAFINHARLASAKVVDKEVSRLMREAWIVLKQRISFVETAGDSLHRAVLQLPLQHRAAFIAHSVLGLSNDETAYILEVDTERAVTIWGEALIKLRGLLGSARAGDCPLLSSTVNQGCNETQQSGSTGSSDRCIASGEHQKHSSRKAQDNRMVGDRKDTDWPRDLPVRDCYRRSFEFLYRMIDGDEKIAEHLAELAVTQSLKRGRDFHERVSLTYQIAMHLAITHLRGIRRPTVDESRIDKRGSIDYATRPNQQSTLSAQSGKRMASIRHAIAALPDLERAAVLMHKYGGLQSRQIGEILDLRESSVKALLLRTYRRLHERLSMPE